LKWLKPGSALPSSKTPKVDMPDSPQQRSHGYARSGAGFGRQCRWCITVVASCRTRSQFSCSSWCSKHSQLINNVTHRDTDYTITTAAGEHPASRARRVLTAGSKSTRAESPWEPQSRSLVSCGSRPGGWIGAFWRMGLVPAAQHQGTRAANVLCTERISGKRNWMACL
jgi:hypothetical protein